MQRVMNTIEKSEKKALAVIATGGKQYIVSRGDVIDVELITDKKPGDTVEFNEVLLTDDGSNTVIGTPYTNGKVTGTYLEERKGKKLSIIRFKAKSNRDRKIGHRQRYSRIKIENID